MTKKVAVIGSCVTRDVFSSRCIPDYKNFFEVVADAWQTSFASLMSNPVSISEEYLATDKEIRPHRYKTMIRDIDKQPLKEILKEKPDIIIFDLYADVNYGFIKVKKDSSSFFLTNNPNCFRKTKYYRDKQFSKSYNVNYNKRFSELFFKSFSEFYEIVRKNLPDTKILMNGFFESYGYIDERGYTMLFSEDKQQKSAANNKLYEEFYQKIIEAYPEIEFIEMNKKMYFGSLTHPFGNQPYHFNQQYYDDLFNKLLKVSFEQ